MFIGKCHSQLVPLQKLHLKLATFKWDAFRLSEWESDRGTYSRILTRAKTLLTKIDICKSHSVMREMQQRHQQICSRIQIRVTQILVILSLPLSLFPSHFLVIETPDNVSVCKWSAEIASFVHLLSYSDNCMRAVRLIWLATYNYIGGLAIAAVLQLWMFCWMFVVSCSCDSAKFQTERYDSSRKQRQNASFSVCCS